MIESSESEKGVGPDSQSAQTTSTSYPALGSYDLVAEKRLLRKLDWRFLPLFTLLYCTNFVDRTAIGNAKVAGLERDLHMHGYDFNIALTVFYVCYVAADIPSNLALKHFGSIWMAAMIIGFGVVAVGTAFVKSYAGLIVTRVFLGFTEGGTLSGLSYILSRYYRRSEYVLRIGIFFGLAPALSGAFGGLLASGLLSVQDFGMIRTWRKLFFIEGIITIGIGVACIFIIPTDPETTRMLDDEERALALARIDADQSVRTYGRKERTTLKLVMRAFNFNSIIITLCYIMINISFQGLSLFMPTIVATLGHFTTVQIQLRTVPPFMLGALWSLVAVYTSFRIKQRYSILLFCVLLGVIGYGIAVGTTNSHARYAACFLSVTGASPAGALFLAWATDNAAPDTVRAVTTAIVPGFGAIGAVIAVWTYLPTDAPIYLKGSALNLAASSTACILIAIGAMHIRWENAKRDRGERDYRLEGLTAQEIETLGNLHPNYRYQI